MKNSAEIITIYSGSETETKVLLQTKPGVNLKTEKANNNGRQQNY